MVYAFILAGGSGTRMNSEIPKQFLKLNEVPIIIYTIKKFINNKNIDKIIIACKKNYIEHLKNIIRKEKIDNIDIIEGGKNRLFSTINCINHVKESYDVNNEDVFIAHDSVRPFVSDRIINENVEKVKAFKAATTVMDLIETIQEENEEGLLFKAYPRKKLYSGQSPQSFNINYFLNNYYKVPENLKEIYTDLAEVIYYNDGKVFPVMGDRDNIKITTPIDLTIAENLLRKDKKKF